MNLEGLILRVKEVSGAKRDAHVARELNVSTSNLPTWRERGTIPYGVFVQWADTKNVSLNWLFYGIPPMMKLDDKTFIDFSKTCSDLSLIVGCNYDYSKFLYLNIEKTGKSIDELTVKELLTLHNECGHLHNQQYAKNKMDKTT